MLHNLDKMGVHSLCSDSIMQDLILMQGKYHSGNFHNDVS